MKNNLGLHLGFKSKNTNYSEYIEENVSPSLVMDPVNDRYLIPSFGPELVINPNFENNLDGWDVSASSAPSTFLWSNGRAIAQTDGTNNARIRQMIQTEIGKLYRIEQTSNSSIFVGTSAGGSNYLTGAASVSVRYFTSASTNTWVNSTTSSNGSFIDRISVREVELGSVDVHQQLTNFTRTTSGSASGNENIPGTLVLQGDGTNGITADKQITGLNPNKTYGIVMVVQGAVVGARIGTTQGATNIRADYTYPIGCEVITFKPTQSNVWLRFFRSGATASTISNIYLISYNPKVNLQKCSRSDIVTFTRSTVSSGIDKFGNVVSFGPNTPAISYVDGKPYYGNFNQTTNLFLNSEGTTGINSENVSLSVTSGPVGGQAIIATSTTGIPKISRTISENASGKTYTFSFWAKMGNRNGQTYNATISANGGVDEQYRETTITLSDEWKRYYWTTTFPSGMVQNSVSWNIRPFAGITPIVGSSIQIDGWQVEIGAVTSPYIKTNGSATTRGSDIWQFSPLVSALYDRSATTTLMDFHSVVGNGSTLIGTLTGHRIVGLSNDSTNIGVGETSFSGGPYSNPFRENTIAFRNRSNRKRMALNGTLSIETSNSISEDPSSVSISTLFLGRANMSRVANGFYGKYIMWPVELNDKTISRLSNSKFISTPRTSWMYDSCLAADFIENSCVLNKETNNINSLNQFFTRSSSKTGQDSQYNNVTASSNMPLILDNGFDVREAHTILFPNVLSPISLSSVALSVSKEPIPSFRNFSSGVRITNLIDTPWARLSNSLSQNLVAGSQYSFKALIRKTPSNSASITIRDGTTSQDTRLVTNFDTFETSVQGAGSISSTYILNIAEDVYEVGGIFTPINSGFFSAGIGVGDSIIGNYSDFYAFQIANLPHRFPFSNTQTNSAEALRVPANSQLVNGAFNITSTGITLAFSGKIYSSSNNFVRLLSVKISGDNELYLERRTDNKIRLVSRVDGTATVPTFAYNHSEGETINVVLSVSNAGSYWIGVNDSIQTGSIPLKNALNEIYCVANRSSDTITPNTLIHSFSFREGNLSEDESQNLLNFIRSKNA